MSLKQPISKLILLILVCFLIDSIYAKVVDIQVGGGGEENLKFNPKFVEVELGDIVSVLILIYLQSLFFFL